MEHNTGKSFLKYCRFSIFLIQTLYALNGFSENYNEWKYSTKITINTTATGLSGSVSNFPLLVRLNNTNFDFSKANPDGADIRFSASDNTHLFYERESWDSTNGFADFWVLVTAISSNNSSQYITIHWGKADAPDSSNSEEVFKTSNDFEGVWHLDEDPSGGAGVIKDRTGNSNDGTPGNMNSSDLVNGTIGKALDFDGNNDYINAGSDPSLDNMSTNTISAWIYARDLGESSFGRIVAKNTYKRLFLGENGSIAGKGAIAYHRSRTTAHTDVRSASNTLEFNVWVHVACVMNETSYAKLYINGLETSYSPNNMGSGTIGNDALENLYIGNTASGNFTFNGRIDELRVSSSVRSADWIKLNFETQKSTQEMVVVHEPEMAIFATHPQSDTVNMGELVSFTATANGSPSPNYQWQKYTSGWSDISSASSSTYSITSTHALDTGRYRAIASNASGSDTSAEAYLYVIVGVAVLTQEPEPDTVCLKGSKQFTVIATGIPTPTYQWLKDGSPITGENSSTLTISSVSANDEGYYQAIASNYGGSDTSEKAYLYLYDSTITVISQPQNDTAMAGQTALYEITCTGHNLLYQWQQMNPGWTDIVGETSKSLTFTVDSSHDGRYVRCVITSGPVSMASSPALIYMATTPLIISALPSDTTVITGGTLSLTADALAKPPPQYTWYYKQLLTSDSSVISTGSVLSLSNVTKDTKGIYFFVADNGFERTQSNALSVYIADPVSITIDLPNKYLVINSGTVMLNPDISGDGTITYQWYENGSVLPGEINNYFRINSVDSVSQNNNTYYCQISNMYLNTLISTVSTKVCTLVVNKFYNPFKVKAERISMDNTDQVRIKLWSDVDITNFPCKDPVFPPSPWADSVWVLYKSNGFVMDINDASIAFFSTEHIKNSPDTLIDTVNVGLLPPGNDSCFWFNYAVLWHNPITFSDTLVKPFIEANKVFMLDTLTPTNSLVVTGTYIMKSDTVVLRIDSTHTLAANLDSTLIIQCSYYPQFNALFRDTALSVQSLLTSGTGTSIIFDNIGTLPVELDTVYCRWFIVGTNSMNGTAKNTSFTIGWSRPVYSGNLKADSTLMGHTMHLEWDTPLPEVDTIRIWWDTKPVILSNDIPLPEDQAHYVRSLSLTTDTVIGLTNNTMYYFGLQVFKDDMWSTITAQSSAYTKTSLGDTSQISNVIAIDSSWFNDTTNSMEILWHIPFDSIPENKTAVMGYTYTLDDGVNTSVQPGKWYSITTEINKTSIPLYPDITFDTVYTIGFWLCGVSATLGKGLAAFPTVSSIAKIQIPSFTWQEITFFPESVDTVYAANKKIILTKDYPFTKMDTVRAFSPGSIPVGFVQVGGIYFNFGDKNLQVPSFILGLKYDSLPSGISDNNLGLYQYKNGNYHILHGFKVENKAVWDTVSVENFAYPFLVLADTISPKITVSPFNDTVSPDNTVITNFEINDNNANTYWRFLYGSGHNGYTYGESGYLSNSLDTSLEKTIIDKNFVINPSSGLRAIIIASDGISTDTFNVSRCVRTSKSGSVTIKGQEWMPLSTPANLDIPVLEKIFDKSITSDQNWEYTNTKFRLYRWFTTDGSTQNEWLEYADPVKDVFSFIPGRLIWCKTAETQVVTFGKGVTVSLRKPYEVLLKPNDWTDLTLPFQFPIMLRDVLEATGIKESENLEVYHWEKIGKTYGPMVLYIGSLDTLTRVIDTLNPQQMRNGYLIYNHNTDPITLRIPPTSLPLSRYANPVKTRAEKNLDSWNISVMWKNKIDHNDVFRRLRCGYRKNQQKHQTYGYLPPTMNNMSVGFINADNALCGWMLASSVSKGGIHFELSFRNYSANDRECEYYLDNLGVLPENYQAKILDPHTHTYESCPREKISSVLCKANSTTNRLLVLGTKEYFSTMISAFLPLKLVKTFPNPFNGRMTISYRIPLGIKEIQFLLYNLRGQLLWKGTENHNLTPGYHTYNFNGKTGLRNNNILTSGVYILQLQAKNKSGTSVYGGKKRLNCIK